MAIPGEFIETQVPDTIDLQERARLAINALTRCTNPEADYDVYFSGRLDQNPPVLFRQMRFYGKFHEALTMMRMVTGERTNEHVDQIWRDRFLGWLVGTNPLLRTIDLGRELAWLSLICRIEEDPCLEKLGEDAVWRLLGAVKQQNNYCYYPNDQGVMPTGWEATYDGWTLQGVTQFFLATGYEPARDLAAGLANYLKNDAQIFDGAGRFLARHPSDNGPALHFHHNGNTMLAISEYAAATGDEEFAVFARQGYEYARSTGNPLVGFFPEYINDWPDNRTYVDCETCCTADMIIMALMLIACGQGDYWDDVDRYVRNQLIEMQITNGEWIEEIAIKQPPGSVDEDETADHVSERVVGSFAGWATANDFIPDLDSPFISGCCTGNGSRALYYVWEKMVSFKDGVFTLNLLLNRPSPWADVNSYIPYKGQVDVMMKADCPVEIRIPEWVRQEGVACTVNGSPRELTFRGRYAWVGWAERDNLVTLTFPISERTVETIIGDRSCKLIIKGNDVVSIEPSGIWYPFYQRANYRKDEVRWVKRKRFIPWG